MAQQYIIIIVLLALCLPKATCTGTEPPKSSGLSNRTLEPPAASIRDTGNHFSQTVKQKTGSSITGQGNEKPEEKTGPPKILKKENHKQKNIKKMKPFIPSETIPADQGVDFPYDI